MAQFSLKNFGFLIWFRLKKKEHEENTATGLKRMSRVVCEIIQLIYSKNVFT